MTEKFEKGTEQLSQKPQENTTKNELIWVLDDNKKWDILEEKDIEKIKQAEDILSPEQIQAIWEKNILDKKMTNNKLIVIWQMLWVEDIKQITPEKLVEMRVTELNHYVKFLDKVDPTQLKNMSLKDIEFQINMIKTFETITKKMSLDEMATLVTAMTEFEEGKKNKSIKN